jgi:hypothetical protein
LGAGLGDSSRENILGREQTREAEGEQIVKETSYVVRFDNLRAGDEEIGLCFDKRGLVMPWEALGSHS